MPHLPEITVVPADIDVPTLLTHGAPTLPSTVRAPFVARDPDGEIVLAAGKLGGPVVERLRSAARGYPAGNTLRSSGIRNLSRSFGYVSRNQILQRNVCRACSGASEAPGQHLALVNAATQLAEVSAEFYPDRFTADMGLVGEAVLPEWRMSPTGPWTSGVVNFDSPLPYHYDRNNFDVFSTMVTFRRGILGGYLHCPGWTLEDGTPVVLPCGDGGGHDVQRADRAPRGHPVPDAPAVELPCLDRLLRRAPHGPMPRIRR